MKRGVRVLVLGLVAVFALAASPAFAASDRPTESYLALGDSYAFAYNPIVVASGQASDPTKFRGYTDLVGMATGLHLTNAACPGETSQSMITGERPDNGCQDYRALFPLHTDYRGAQLKFALHFLRTHHDTDLVTLQIGGNDVLVLLKQCSGNTGCVLNGLGPVLATMKANLDTIYDAIRNRAHYEGTIVAVPYFSFNYNDTGLTTITTFLDDAVKAEALEHGAKVADVFSAFAAASAKFGGVPCFAGLQVITAPPSATNPFPTCDIHPSAAGHAVIAAAVLAVLPREDKD